VFAYVGRDHFTMLRSGIVENPLHQVVAVLVASNVDQGNSSSVTPSFTDTVEIPSQEVAPAYLQALLHDLRGKLIGAVLGSVADDMVNSSATVRRSPVFTYVLDAPIAELAMCDNVNVRKNLFDARTLGMYFVRRLIGGVTGR
jgi:hypothetical protein